MPLDEDQCKSEAVRLLWDGDGLQKLLTEFVKAHGFFVHHITVTEDFSLRANRLKTVRLRGRVAPFGTRDEGLGAYKSDYNARPLMAKLRRFAMRVLHCQPKMSTSRGVVYFDFNVVLPAPVVIQEG